MIEALGIFDLQPVRNAPQNTSTEQAPPFLLSFCERRLVSTGSDADLLRRTASPAAAGRDKRTEEDQSRPQFSLKD